MKTRVLLVDDEPAIAIPLADRLKQEDYEVQIAQDGQLGYDMAIRRPFELMILDLMLPRRNGLDVCRDLRQNGVQLPILMLTAKTQVTDKVVGLKIGADDYLTKPFDMSELLARMEVLLRRVPPQPAGSRSLIQFGNVRIDLRRAEVWREGNRVALSPKEFQLLQYLVEHPDTVVSREQLLSEVWGYDATTSTRTVDVHIGWLRQKLEDDPKHPRLIETVIGSGYKLAP